MTPRSRTEPRELAAGDPARLRWTPPRGTAKDWADVLATLPLFSGLGKRQVRKIAGLAEVETFEPGDFVVQHGEAGDAAYVILHGTAKVLGQRRARLLRDGDFFGEMSLLDGGPRAATVTAASELVALKLRHRPFLKMLESDPRIALGIMRELSGRIRRAQRAPAP